MIKLTSLIHFWFQISLVFLGVIYCANSTASDARDRDPVLQILQESRPENFGINPKKPLNTVCLSFSQLEHPEKLSQSEADALASLISSRLKEQDPAYLQARADIARLGLYGIKKNLRQALQYYLLAGQKGSSESGYNAALILYYQSGQSPDIKTAQKILKILSRSGADQVEKKGIVAAQSQYLAAIIYDRALAGKKNVGRAFKLYRAAANNRYGPAVRRYLEMMIKSVSKLSPQDRLLYINEIENLIHRWKWHDPRIMELAGDLYYSGWLEDVEGFYTQYHWRLAAYYYGAMGESGENIQKTLHKEKIAMLVDEAIEERLKRAIEMAIASRRFQYLDNTLRYVNKCF